MKYVQIKITPPCTTQLIRPSHAKSCPRVVHNSPQQSTILILIMTLAYLGKKMQVVVITVNVSSHTCLKGKTQPCTTQLTIHGTSQQKNQSRPCNSPDNTTLIMTLHPYFTHSWKCSTFDTYSECKSKAPVKTMHTPNLQSTELLSMHACDLMLCVFWCSAACSWYPGRIFMIPWLSSVGLLGLSFLDAQNFKLMCGQIQSTQLHAPVIDLKLPQKFDVTWNLSQTASKIRFHHGHFVKWSQAKLSGDQLTPCCRLPSEDLACRHAGQVWT